MTKKFIDLFTKIWRADDKHISGIEPDTIIALSYAVKKEALTNGTREALKTAIGHWKKFPSALLVFASSSHCFSGSERTEERLKFEILDQAGIPRESVLSCGPVVNTVTEAEAICRVLQRAGKQPKTILLVTGLLHSRSARLVWRKMLGKYFPETEFAISAIPPEYEYQKDHPLFFQHGPIRWVVGNLIRQAILIIFGIALAGKFYDPSNLD